MNDIKTGRVYKGTDYLLEVGYRMTCLDDLEIFSLDEKPLDESLEYGEQYVLHLEGGQKRVDFFVDHHNPATGAFTVRGLTGPYTGV